MGEKSPAKGSPDAGVRKPVGVRTAGLSVGAVVAWALLLGLLAIVALGLVRAQQGPIQVGAAAPDFRLETFGGDPIRLADLRGQVVVINFWASWCHTCEDEAAALEQAHQEFRDRGVVFLGVNYVDTQPEALAYLERFGITYPNGPDLGTRISQAFRIRGVPETYIVGRQGILVDLRIGPYASLSEIEDDVEEALAQP